MQIGVEMNGGAALERELRKFGPKLAGTLMRRAASSAMLPVKKRMEALAPVRDEPGMIGGTLRESIIKTSKHYKASGKILVFVGVKKFGAKQPIGLKGRKVVYANPTNYAHLLEFGHRIAVGGTLTRAGSDKRAGTGAVGGFVDARPFIARALKETAGAVTARLVQQLRRGIDREARKIAAAVRATKGAG
jgi:HK97 gp10 family phage protein